MATVIDALFVEFGLDATKFTKGQKEVVVALKKTEEQATSTAKEMERRGVQAAEFFSGVAKAITEMTAAFLSADAIKNMAERVIGTETALQGLSVKINSSVSDIASWGSAVSVLSGHFVDMGGVLESAQEKINEFNLGGAGNAAAVTQFQALSNALRITGQQTLPADFFSRYIDPAKSLTDKLKEIQPYFYALGHSGAKGMALGFTAGHGLGYSDDLISAMMKKAPADFNKLLGTMAQENGVTAKGAAQALEISQTWEHIGNLMRGIGTTITETLYPLISSVLDVMVGILNVVNKWVKANPQIAAGIALIGVAVTSLLALLDRKSVV